MNTRILSLNHFRTIDIVGFEVAKWAFVPKLAMAISMKAVNVMLFFANKLHASFMSWTERWRSHWALTCETYFLQVGKEPKHIHKPIFEFKNKFRGLNFNSHISPLWKCGWARLEFVVPSGPFYSPRNVARAIIKAVWGIGKQINRIGEVT